MGEPLRGTVLITRPEQDAIEIAKILEDENYQVICEPFLKVTYDDFTVPDLTQYAGLIFTSANAVRAIEGKFNYFDIPVFCVGNQTHDEAVRVGFKDVQSAEGAIGDLTCLIISQTPNKPYLYVRGRQISKDLKALMSDVQIDEIIVYHTEKAKEISSVTRQVLLRGEMSFVLFFSKRTATAFIEWVKADSQAESLAAALGRSRALCLGDSMVEYLSKIPWKEIQVADHPDRMSLMKLL
jgi:uroporphyrinogen-III synthase